jgi:hypothetical protein
MFYDKILTIFPPNMLKRHIINAISKTRNFSMASEKTGATPKKIGLIVHGLYAKDVLLPWDDREEFAALHSGLKQEFFPSGQSEEECVLDLAQLYWQKRTLSRLRTAAVLRDPFTSEIVATEKKSWSGIRRTLRENAREEGRLVRTMENSVAKAIAEIRRLGKKLAKDVPFEEVEKLTPLLRASIELASKSLLPLLEQVRQLPDAEGAFDKNYLPDALEKNARLEAMIDARIGKILARLVALKEFKRTPAGSPLAQLTASR